MPELEQATLVGEITIRPDLYQAYAAESSLELTVREFEILNLLSQSDRVLRREEIYERVWGYAMAHGDRSVDVFVRKLRQKLRAASPHWSYIHTHFGVGYRFAPEPDDAASVEIPADLRDHAGDGDHQNIEVQRLRTNLSVGAVEAALGEHGRLEVEDRHVHRPRRPVRDAQADPPAWPNCRHRLLEWLGFGPRVLIRPEVIGQRQDLDSHRLLEGGTGGVVLQFEHVLVLRQVDQPTHQRLGRVLVGDGQLGAQTLQAIAHIDEPALQQGLGHGTHQSTTPVPVWQRYSW